MVGVSHSGWNAIGPNYRPSQKTTHSDGATFSDGTKYRGRTMCALMHEAAEIGQTVVKIEVVYGLEHVSGLRFSHEWALYETGPYLSNSQTVFEVPISPAIRRRIPAGAELELDEPGCLMRLITDSAMDISLPLNRVATANLAFTEALEVWEELVENDAS